MLRKSASGGIDTREASFVSGFGCFTNDEDGLFSILPAGQLDERAA
jgi:hypothetical protein